MAEKQQQRLETTTKLAEKQVIAVKQILQTRLLELPSVNLQDEVLKELDENPALEMDTDSEDMSDGATDGLVRQEQSSPRDDYGDNTDDWDSNDYARMSETYDTKADYGKVRHQNDDIDSERPMIARTSLVEDLLQQLGELSLSEEDRMVAEYIIGNLEEDGYLKRTVFAIATDMLVQYNLDISQEKIESIITNVIQTLEPTGIGARNLQECLSLQLRALWSQEKNPLLQQTLHIVDHYFDDLSKHNYERIQRMEQLTKEQMAEVVQMIRRLNPKPGGAQDSTVYIHPDFIVKVDGEQVLATLANEYHPQLRVRSDYEKMLSEKRLKRDAAAYLKQKIESAQMFIMALKERDRTMQKVMNAMIEWQHDYFVTGDKAKLKPMILQNIADKIGMDVSTVSRVTSHCYADTAYGMVALKSLFSEAPNDDGVSSYEIKETIKELVENEDKEDPYTDDSLVKLLEQKNYHISRRTVAKYRMQLGIAPISQRRKRL